MKYWFDRLSIIIELQAYTFCCEITSVPGSKVKNKKKINMSDSNNLFKRTE